MTFGKRIFENKKVNAIGKCRIRTSSSANQIQMPENKKMIHSTTSNKTTIYNKHKKKKHNKES